MPTPYTPLAIANRFIEGHAGQNGIEHMKLQKLVYYSYGWWLAVEGMDAVRLTNEGPEIWKHGPVFESLYHSLSLFGRSPIMEAQATRPFAEPDRIDPDDENVHRLVDWVWAKYGHLSSFALSNMTHRAGSSWHRVATENNFRIAFNTEIPDQYIFEEFTELMDGDLGRATVGAGGVDEHRTRQA